MQETPIPSNVFDELIECGVLMPDPFDNLIQPPKSEWRQQTLAKG